MDERFLHAVLEGAEQDELGLVIGLGSETVTFPSSAPVDRASNACNIITEIMSVKRFPQFAGKDWGHRDPLVVKLKVLSTRYRQERRRLPRSRRSAGSTFDRWEVQNVAVQSLGQNRL